MVTVSLEEARPFSVAVMGEVIKPGCTQVPPGPGVLQALAAAGGFNQYASRDRIFVVRDAPDASADPLQRSSELTQAEGKAATFRLRPGTSWSWSERRWEWSRPASWAGPAAGRSRS